MGLNAESLKAAREQIERIQSVDRAQVRTDHGGTVIGVDLIADVSRSAQRIVRDVEVVLRGFAVDLDHRKISVAQLEDPLAFREQGPESVAPPSPVLVGRDTATGEESVLELSTEPERLRPVAVHSTTRGGAFAVEVELVYANLEGSPGRAEGPASDPAGCLHLVAEAALDAVRNLLEPGYEAQLREVRRLTVGGRPAVVAALDFGDGRRLQRLVGSSPDHGSLYDAAVYAVLDALNRPLGRARFRVLTLLESDESEPRLAQAEGV